MIPGVAQAVLGTQPGESKTVEVSVEDGFGPRNPDLEQRVARSILPEGVQVGERLHAKVGEKAIVICVREIGDEFAVLDVNHPLAGHSLIFKIELVPVQSKEG